MECQFLIAQQAVLLQQGATLHRLRRQSRRPVALSPCRRRFDAAGQLAMRRRAMPTRLQLTPDLVPGEEIEYADLDRAFLKRVGSGGCGS
jgi:hypothetical protein